MKLKFGTFEVEEKFESTKLKKPDTFACELCGDDCLSECDQCEEEFEEPDDPLYRKVKEALRQLNKPCSKEELKKQRDELDKIEREQGLEAMNKELFRRAGLSD